MTAARAVAGVAICAAVACSGDGPPPATTRRIEVLPREPGVLRLTGSGTVVPLVRSLAVAFRAAVPGSARLVIEDSVGSGGGVQAALDGAVDIGMVSRRLSAREAELPLLVLPIARDAVVFAAHPDVSVDGVDSEEVVALFDGRRHVFADGSPATPLLRDRSESANLVLDGAIPGMAAAREHAYRLGFRVLYHDDTMAAALAVTPGAIGVHSLGLLAATRIHVKVLRLDGKTPSVAGLAEGSWRMSRPVAFVLRPDRVAAAEALLLFARSPEGRRAIEAAAYLPLTPSESLAGPVPAAIYQVTRPQ